MDDNCSVNSTDMDSLDGASSERTVQGTRATTSDDKEVEEMKTPPTLRDFTFTVYKDGDYSQNEEVDSHQDSTSDGFNDKDSKRRLESSDGDSLGRKKFHAASSVIDRCGRINNGNDEMNKFAELGLVSPPDLPVSFREDIARKSGTDIALVMMKELQLLHWSAQESTVSLAALQLNQNFLTEEERRRLDEEDGVIEMTLIQPCHEEISLGMKKLYMSRDNCYLLNGQWRSVSENEKNGLQANDIVQLWSFRYG